MTGDRREDLRREAVTTYLTLLTEAELRGLLAEVEQHRTNYPTPMGMGMGTPMDMGMDIDMESHGGH